MKKVAKPAGHHQTVRQLMLGTVSTLGVLAAAATTASAKTITVKQGDTVWNLTNQAGVSVKAVEQANPSVTRLNNSVDLIHAGQTLNLPSADSYYVVQSGDTLGQIAHRYHVTVGQLTAWNQLSNPDLIHVGQRLLVRGGQVADQASATPATDPAAATTVVPQQSQSNAQQQDQQQQAQQPTTAPVSGQQQAQPAASQPTAQTGQPAAQAGQSADQQAVQTSQPAQPTAAPAQESQAAQPNQDASAAPVADQQTATSQETTNQSTTANNDQPQEQQSFNVANSQQQSAAPQVQWGQSAVAQPQAPANYQQDSQTTNQPAQQQTPANNNDSTAQAPATNQQNGSQNSANADLQTGSVVSLAVKLANSNIPYVYGGNSLSGMDCSGLVDYVYAHSEGKQLPHYTVSLESCVSQKPVSQAQPGDLLFWGQHGSTYHVAIYIGNNQYVAAPQPGQNVEIQTISPYFAPSFAGSVN